MRRDERLARMLRTSMPDIDWDRIEHRLRDTSGDTSWPSFLSGLLLGAVVGVIVALALAPQSGRHTRRQVWETTIDLRSRARRPAAPDETLIDAAEHAEIEMLRRMGPSPV